MVMTVQNREEIEAEVKALRDKRKAEQESREKQKKGWYGLVYCDGEYASIIDFIDGSAEAICLGKTDEIIPYLKSQGIGGDNINSVLLAAEDFRAEQKNQEKTAKAKNSTPRVSKTQSCHSATKKPQRYISIPPPKSHRATSEDNPPNLASQHPFFKKDQKLFNLLKSLTDRDIGTPTIHRELNEQGYAIPYRTVGRWVAQMRSRELL